MRGTFPSPAVKEKHKLQSRLKARVSVLRSKSGAVWCGREGGYFNAWSGAGIIDFNTKWRTRSVARFQINDTVQNVCHVECKAPGKVWKMQSGTNLVMWRNLQVHEGRTSLSETDSLTEADSPVPSDGYDVCYSSHQIHRKNEAQLWNLTAYAKERHLRGSYRDQSSGCDGLIK